MSTSIGEGIEYHELRAKQLRAIKKRFPDARLDGNRWRSGAVLEVATGIELETQGDPAVSRLIPYVEVEDLRVYAEWGSDQYATVALWRFQERHPKEYAALVKFVADGCP